MSKLTDNEFGSSLGQLIADNGISMRELERKSGVSREAIRRWIYGRASARIELAECVLEVLGYKLEVVKCNR